MMILVKAQTSAFYAGTKELRVRFGEQDGVIPLAKKIKRRAS